MKLTIALAALVVVGGVASQADASPACPPTAAEVVQKVDAVIADRLEADASQLSAADHFVEDLAMDELGAIELMLGIEDQFGGFQIPGPALETIETVGDLRSYMVGVCGL